MYPLSLKFAQSDSCVVKTAHYADIVVPLTLLFLGIFASSSFISPTVAHAFIGAGAAWLAHTAIRIVRCGNGRIAVDCCI